MHNVVKFLEILKHMMLIISKVIFHLMFAEEKDVEDAEEQENVAENPEKVANLENAEEQKDAAENGKYEFIFTIHFIIYY
jgi:hypothetical protein